MCARSITRLVFWNWLSDKTMPLSLDNLLIETCFDFEGNGVEAAKTAPTVKDSLKGHLPQQVKTHHIN
jgi:hypothetical protein